MGKGQIGVIGTGMGSLSAAVLLAQAGYQLSIFEQNWQAGGCTTSYWRKGFVFEAGATTLVGLDPGMPLAYILEKTGIELPAWKLDTPMQVHIDGEVITRYQDLEQWIVEAERVFGVNGQRGFWQACYAIAQFVWRVSSKQRWFPPTTLGDLWQCAIHANPEQLWFARYAFVSTQSLLQKHGLVSNERFVRFVNQQLLITAQNHASEVNALFGAAALCYTNFGNYYMPGGLVALVQPFVDYLTEKGAQFHFRHAVTELKQQDKGYLICTNKGEFAVDYVVSGIPANNLANIWPQAAKKLAPKLMESKQLNSAFQVGIAFRTTRRFECIHYQLHLAQSLPIIGSASIFISLSHPDDHSRCNTSGVTVASVSTHVSDPARFMALDKQVLVEAVLAALVQHGFFEREDVVYIHSSDPKEWQKWTGRQWGFVGGYPQFMHTKPWQMIGHRLDGKGAYLCGDSTYPGQGIPGASLSGIITAQKLLSDW